MSAEKMVQETKGIIRVSFLAGLVLLITWFMVEMTELSFANNKAMLALSLIPFSDAAASFLKLTR
jgi:hypothetical protein